MRVERVYDWSFDDGIEERDPTRLDPNMIPQGATRLGHISDTHLGKGSPGRRQRQLRRWLETLSGLDVDAIIHSGDLVEVADDDDEIDRAFALFDKMTTPVLGVPGNHDVKEPAEAGEVNRRWGPFPRSVAVGALRLWLLDSMAWPPVDQRSPEEHQSAEESGFYSRGALGPSQLKQLAEEFKNAGDPTGPEVAVVHHHLRQPIPPKPFYEENADLMAPLDDADDLIEVLRRRGVQLVLHGHRHQYVTPYAPFEDLVILNAGSSTPGTTPLRARLVDIADSESAIRIWELVRFR